MAIDTSLDPDLLVPWLRREAIALGENDRSIAAKLRSGEWHRVRYGAYVGGAVWKGLGAEDRHRVRARAVLKAAHPSTVLSHSTAAVELGAPIWDIDLSRVHVTRTDGHPGRKTLDVAHHNGLMTDAEVITRHGVPLVNATRAAFEVTTIADVERSLVVVDGLLRLGETDLPQLDAFAAARRHWPNSLTTDMVVRLADPRHGSAGESRCHYLFFRQGLPMPVPQYAVRDEHGNVVAYTDFAWPDLGVFVEFDGRLKYEQHLAPGQSPIDAMLAQQRREELICRLTGWVCIRLTWRDLSSPHATARRIRAVLVSRRPAA